MNRQPSTIAAILEQEGAGAIEHVGLVAAVRKLDIPFYAADMRDLYAALGAGLDAVICMDNALRLRWDETPKRRCISLAPLVSCEFETRIRNLDKAYRSLLAESYPDCNEKNFDARR